MEKYTMGLFGDRSKDFFNNVYENDVPWEIGRIQPDLLKLIEEIPPEGKILDVGCGSGETTIDLGRLGYDVIGIDFVDKAILRAKEKIIDQKNNQRLKIRFILGDGLKPTKYVNDLGAVIDSGFMHLFNDKDILDYIHEIHNVLSIGGRIYLIEFAHDFNIPNTPRSITKQNIYKIFKSDLWNIIVIRDGMFVNKVSPVPATIACIQKN